MPPTRQGIKKGENSNQSLREEGEEGKTQRLGEPFVDTGDATGGHKSPFSLHGVSSIVDE